jgi:addiction module HigA family antidote
MKSNMRPVHPGEVLREEFLGPIGVSANALAIAIGVSANRITEIAAERRNITAETALLLGKALDTSADFWMNLQKAYDLRVAEKAIGKKLESVRSVRTA